MTRSGLTLAELLVVLTILAITASVAVVMTDGVVEQGRLDATLRSLQEVRQGIVHSDEPNGSISGFVTDIGRLPKTTDLSELYAGTAAPVSYPIDADEDSVPDMVLTAGWNGPYLALGPGVSALLDGWGRPFLPDITVPWAIYSDGALPVPADNLVLSLSPGEYKASQITFEMREMEDGQPKNPTLQATESLHLNLFFVQNAVVVPMRVTTKMTGTTVDYTNSAGTGTYSFPSATPLYDFVVSPSSGDDSTLGNTFGTSLGIVGTVAARAVIVDGNNAPVKRSLPFYIRIQPGAHIRQTLTLRNIS